MIKKIFSLLFFVIPIWATPKLTVIIVVDSFAHHYIEKLESRFQYGFHKLLSEGVIYDNAFYPHAVLSTAVGHTTLGTGTVPAQHGIVANTWYDPDGLEHGLTAQTCAQEMMVPTLTEKFLNMNSHNRAFALGGKDRVVFGVVGAHVPAVCTNDDMQFDAWHADDLAVQVVKRLNEQLSQPRLIRWHQAYRESSYYHFPFVDDYSHAVQPSMFLEKSYSDMTQSRKNFVTVLQKLPEANTLMLDGAAWYIKETIRTLAPDGSLVVWIGLWTLDKVGHFYGPYSREAIDTLYHMDKQIGDFITKIAQVVNPHDTLYVLTADHGMMPIAELAKKNHPQARRVMTRDLITTINKQVQKQFGVSEIINRVDEPNVYMDQKKFKNVSEKHQQEIRKLIKRTLSTYTGIVTAFDTQELAHQKVKVGSVAWRYKNNIYSGRSGDFMFHTAPYCVVSSYKTGTSHYMAQPYDMHVPIMLYQPGVLKHRVIKKHVWVNQLTTTLARMLGVKDTYPFAPLPG